MRVIDKGTGLCYNLLDRKLIPRELNLLIVANIIWLLISGLAVALVHFVVGVALLCTVVFIPTGLQFIKIGRYLVCPFGQTVTCDFDRHAISNSLWLITVGWILFTLHVAVGVLLCLSLVGIPFARKCFTLAKLTLFPFGAIVS